MLHLSSYLFRPNFSYSIDLLSCLEFVYSAQPFHLISSSLCLVHLHCRYSMNCTVDVQQSQIVIGIFETQSFWMTLTYQRLRLGQIHFERKSSSDPNRLVLEVVWTRVFSCHYLFLELEKMPMNQFRLSDRPRSPDRIIELLRVITERSERSNTWKQKAVGGFIKSFPWLFGHLLSCCYDFLQLSVCTWVSWWFPADEATGNMRSEAVKEKERCSPPLRPLLSGSGSVSLGFSRPTVGITHWAVFIGQTSPPAPGLIQ